MPIIRLNRDDLRMGKDAIRSIFGLTKKDQDKEVYRVLIPLVESSSDLVNIVEAFIDSKNACDYKKKYSYHCADKRIVETIVESVDNGSINGYKEFTYDEE